MTRTAKVAMALLISVAAGCGGGSGGGSGPAGVDSSKSVATVTDAEKGSLCDWFVGMVGGYGAPATCASAQLMAPPDKATCMMTFPSCDVTVAQFEDCVQRMVAAQNACTDTAIATAIAAPSCQTVGMAGCFNN